MERLSNALDDLTPYYRENHLRANPSKTQVCAFHLRNREAKRQLNVSWSGTALETCQHPVYLGVTLDRCLTFKTHVEKTKAKVCARNNIVSKLTGTRWGASPPTLRSTALALCYSSAEYACPVWERSVHADKVDPALNATCRLITGCLRPTPTNSLYILSGIAPPGIRREAASSKERHRQSTDERHPLYGHEPTRSRLRSRKSFVSTVDPSAKVEHTRMALWKERMPDLPRKVSMSMNASEDLPPGADSKYAEWKCLNRLRTGTGRCKETLKKWGYRSNNDVKCDCGAKTQTMAHLLRCPLLEQKCKAKDLAEYNDVAKKCVQHWLKHSI